MAYHFKSFHVTIICLEIIYKVISPVQSCFYRLQWLPASGRCFLMWLSPKWPLCRYLENTRHSFKCWGESQTSPAGIWASLFQCWRVDTLTHPFHSIVKGLGVGAGVKARSSCNRTSEHLHITMDKSSQFEPSQISWARNIWSFVWPQIYKLNYASSLTFFACLNDVNKGQHFGTFEHTCQKVPSHCGFNYSGCEGTKLAVSWTRQRTIPAPASLYY